LSTISLEKFHQKDVDLSKYFTNTELVKMNFHEQRRLKNIAQNYGVMIFMGQYYTGFSTFIVLTAAVVQDCRFLSKLLSSHAVSP